MRVVACTDAWGHVANDVLLLGRPEISELAEPAVPGRGGSSTMPHKTNPVLSVLIRRAALSTPGLAAQLHVWLRHQPRRTLRRRLARRVVGPRDTRAALARGRLAGHRAADRAARGPGPDAANAEAAAGDLLAESRAMADRSEGVRRASEQLGRPPGSRRPTHRRHPGPGRSEGAPMTVPDLTATQLAGAPHLPLLLCGPSLGTSVTALWSAAAEHLGRGFHVVGWDLPGHGNSATHSGPSTSPTSLPAYSRWPSASSMERGQPGGSFGYAGDSVGGAVGLQLLLDAPDRITACRDRVQRGPHRHPRDVARTCRDGPHLGHPGDARAVLPALVRPGLHRSSNPPCASALLHSLQAADRAGVRRDLRRPGRLRRPARLDEIATPVLAIAGRARRRDARRPARRPRYRRPPWPLVVLPASATSRPPRHPPRWPH